MDQHKHSSEQGKFMAIRAASGALRGVAQHSVTPLCIPLSLPNSHHHHLSPKLLASSLSITCHISWLISAPEGAASCRVSWGNRAAQQQRGHTRIRTSAASLESPLSQTSPGGEELGRGLPVQLMPPTPTNNPHSKQITALETMAPGRHEPPNICKQPDWLVRQDFCKICFHLPYSSSCPPASG